MITLESLRFIVEFLKDGNARQAALRTGIPETYAARHGAWLKKQPYTLQALEVSLDTQDQLRLEKALREIEKQMHICKEILGLEDYASDVK